MQFGTFLDAAGDFFDTVHFPPSLKRWPFKEGVPAVWESSGGVRLPLHGGGEDGEAADSEGPELLNNIAHEGELFERISIVLWLGFIYSNQEGIKAEKLK